MSILLRSDATPIVEYTRNVVYIQDGEIAIIEGCNLTIKTIDNSIKTPYIQEIEFNLENIEKGGYEHFMLKEIFEQPRSIMDSFREDFTCQMPELQWLELICLKTKSKT